MNIKEINTKDKVQQELQNNKDEQVQLSQQEQQLSQKQEELDKKIQQLENDDEDIKYLSQQQVKLNKVIDQSNKQLKAMNSEQLEEISEYKNPPERIKKSLQLIYLLLDGEVYEDWNVLKKKLNDGKFISRIKKFKLDSVKPEILKRVRKEFIDTDDWNLEKTKKASRAMGPIGSFLEQVDIYSNIQAQKSTKKGKKQQQKLKQLKKLKKQREQLPEQLEDLNQNLQELKQQQEKLNQKIQNMSEEEDNNQLQSTEQESHQHGHKHMKGQQSSSGSQKKTIKKLKQTVTESKCGNCKYLLEEIEKLQNCENCKYLEQRIDDYQAELEECYGEIEKLKDCDNCKYLDEQFHESLKKIGELSSQVVQLKNCQNCKDLQDEVNQLNELLDDKEKAIVDLKICENCRNYKMEIEEMTEEINMQKGQIEELEDCSGCQALQGQLDDKNNEVDDLNKKVKDLENCQHCKDKQDQIKKLEKELDQKKKDFEAQKNCKNCADQQQQINEYKIQLKEKNNTIEKLKDCNKCKDLTKQINENDDKLHKEMQSLKELIEKLKNCNGCSQKQKEIDDLNNKVKDKDKELEEEKKKNLPKEETDTMSLDNKPKRDISGTLPAEDDEPEKDKNPIETLPKDCQHCLQYKDLVKQLKQKLIKIELDQINQNQCGNCKDLIDLVEQKNKDIRQMQIQILKQQNCENCKKHIKNQKDLLDKLTFYQIKLQTQEGCKQCEAIGNELKNKQKEINEIKNSKPSQCLNCQNLKDEIKNIKMSTINNNGCDKCDYIVEMYKNLQNQNKKLYDKMSSFDNCNSCNQLKDMLKIQEAELKSIVSKTNIKVNCTNCPSLQNVINRQSTENQSLRQENIYLKKELAKLRDNNNRNISQYKTVKQSVYQTRNISTENNKPIRYTYEPSRVLVTHSQHNHQCNICSGHDHCQCSYRHNHNLDYQNLLDKNTKLENEILIIKKLLLENKQTNLNEIKNESQNYKNSNNKYYSKSTLPKQLTFVNQNQSSCYCQDCSQCAQIQHQGCDRCSVNNQQKNITHRKFYCQTCQSLLCSNNQHQKITKYVMCNYCDLRGCQQCQICMCNNVSESCTVCRSFKISQKDLSKIQQQFSISKEQKTSYREEPVKQSSYNDTSTKRTVKGIYEVVTEGSQYKTIKPSQSSQNFYTYQQGQKIYRNSQNQQETERSNINYNRSNRGSYRILQSEIVDQESKQISNPFNSNKEYLYKQNNIEYHQNRLSHQNDSSHNHHHSYQIINDQSSRVNIPQQQIKRYN